MANKDPYPSCNTEIKMMKIAKCYKQFKCINSISIAKLQFITHGYGLVSHLNGTYTKKKHKAKSIQILDFGFLVSFFFIVLIFFHVKQRIECS